jgi:vacuolar-type H+-ATPase subunit F/Vma7
MHCLRRVELYGPTHFSEILKEVNNRCEATINNQYNQEYQILLILTDGIINDMQQTIDEIVRGSE